MAFDQDILDQKRFRTDIVVDSRLTDGPTAPRANGPSSLTAGDFMQIAGEILGRRRRGKKLNRKPRKHVRKMSLAERRRRAAQHFGTLTPVQKKKAHKRLLALAIKKRLSKMHPKKALSAVVKATKIAKAAKRLKNAIKGNPALKQKLVVFARQRALHALTSEDPGMDSTESTAMSSVPQGEKPSAPPVADPVQPGVEEDHVMTTQEKGEAQEDNAALDAEAPAVEANEEAAAEAEEESVSETEEAQEEAEEESEESLTEPSEEEAQEEASEEADEAVDEETSGLGASIMGAMRKKAKKRAKSRAVHAAARPLAHAIHKKTNGKINAGDTMKGCALISAAKAGNKKAKAAIAALQIAAQKNPKGPQAKTLAHLQLCNKVRTKARKSVAKRMKTPKAHKATRKPGKPNVYAHKVAVIDRGLDSYSAHQRGLAMIPAFARAQFKGVR